MSELRVSWDEYHRLIESLGAQIHRDGWRFDQVLCLARGGLRVGDVLSRMFAVPLAILAVQSYDGDHRQGDLRFSSGLTFTGDRLGPNLLLVDDLVDSGATLIATLDWLEQHHACPRQQVRTAVLWQKPQSQFVPDYRAVAMSEAAWIHQPFEHYEDWRFD